jgi:hypothetical protein
MVSTQALKKVKQRGKKPLPKSKRKLILLLEWSLGEYKDLLSPLSVIFCWTRVRRNEPESPAFPFPSIVRIEPVSV